MVICHKSEPGAEVSNFRNNAVTNRITRYNRLQKERDTFITQTTEENPNLFATKLIKMYREPFLNGSLTEQQRKEVFKAEYFKLLEFNDEALMNSSVYTQRVFRYLMSYAQRGLSREQQEQEFMKAVDVILGSIQQVTASHLLSNSKVYEFILDFLVRGFEKLNLQNILNYIAEKYINTTCQTDEKTTLERRLASWQKMKIGNTVPDFTLNDINGDPITLSQVQKEKTLLLFWASWCPHCTEMLPKLKEWYKTKKPADLEIITVSLDTSKVEWQTFIYGHGFDLWYNLSDLKGWDGEAVLEYNIYATPTLFLIDRNRKVLSKPITLKDILESLKNFR